MSGFYGLESRNVPELELSIIGAGAAGLSAALYSSLLDINYRLLDAEAGGGLLQLAKGVDNYLGLPGLRGPELGRAFCRHLEQVGGRINAFEPVQELHLRQDELQVITAREHYRPKAVIVATGLEVLGLPEEYGLRNERDYLGRGVSYCAECDGPLFKGKPVLVLGNPFDAFLLRRLTEQVTYLGPVPEEFRSQVPREIIEASDIRYREGKLQALEGSGVLQAVVIDGQRLTVAGLFITKRKAGSEVFAKAGLELDDQGFIRTDRQLATNVPGVFAAGDITGEPWQLAKSVGEGAVAALSVFRFLTGQRMRNLGWALQDEWEA